MFRPSRSLNFRPSFLVFRAIKGPPAGCIIAVLLTRVEAEVALLLPQGSYDSDYCIHLVHPKGSNVAKIFKVGEGMGHVAPLRTEYVQASIFIVSKLHSHNYCVPHHLITGSTSDLTNVETR